MTPERLIADFELEVGRQVWAVLGYPCGTRSSYGSSGSRIRAGISFCPCKTLHMSM